MYNLKNIASWWITVTDKNEIISDNVFISYKDSNVIGYLPFKRCKSYSYCEVKDEYVITHVKSVDFLELLFKLKDKKQHIVKFAA